MVLHVARRRVASHRWAFSARLDSPLAIATFFILRALMDLSSWANEQREDDAATSGPDLAGAWYQIYFDAGSSAINARGQMIVKNVAYVIANGGPARVTVIGRTKACRLCPRQFSSVGPPGECGPRCARRRRSADR